MSLEVTEKFVAIPKSIWNHKEAVRFWWKLGWITFGGTAAHLSVMHEELVEKKQWIDAGFSITILSVCYPHLSMGGLA